MRVSFLKKTVCFSLAVVAACGLALADAGGGKTNEDGVDYEDVFSVFEETPESGAPSSPDFRPPSRYRWGGSLTLSSFWNVNHNAPSKGQADYRGLSRLRTYLDLDFRADLADSWVAYVSGRGYHDFAYAVKGRSKYTDQVLDEYENELEFRETYLQGTLLPNLDVTIGRQIMVWGNTENFRITDVLNPVDNRAPGLTDIEYLRLPVCTIKADLHWDNTLGNYTFTFLAIPERRHDKIPVYGNDFYPTERLLEMANFELPAGSIPEEYLDLYLSRYSLEDLIPGGPRLPENAPANTFDNTELAMAFRGIFHRWDLSLYAAYFYDKTGYIKHTGGYYQSVPYFDRALDVWIDRYERRFSRLKMAGLSANFARGSWLYKTEVAWTDGYQYNNVDDKKSHLDILAGFEYMGFSNTTLTLEFVREEILDFDRRLRKAPDFAERSLFSTAFRINRKWLHDRLEGIFLFIIMGAEADDGALQRLSLAYDINDAVTLTGGCVLYQGGEAMIVDKIHRNNRLFFDVTYSF